MKKNILLQSPIFQKGKIVICIRPVKDHLTADRKYVIQRVDDEGMVYVIDDSGATDAWMSNRFVLANQPSYCGGPGEVVLTNTPRPGDTPEQVDARTAPRYPGAILPVSKGDFDKLLERQREFSRPDGIVDAPTSVPPLPPARYLPSDSAKRKTVPMCSGLLDYFPDACAAVAEVSWHGNEKHNPGQPLHWSRGKSMDHADCIMRHLTERGGFDGPIRHSAALAWRALALLQEELENEKRLSMPRGARID